MQHTSLLKLFRRILTILGLLCFAVPASPAEGNKPPSRKYSNVERLALPRLKVLHEDMLKLRAQRSAPAGLPGLNDYRCILHAHAEDSTHTGQGLRIKW